MSARLTLPTPAAQYDMGNEANMRASLERADAQNVKADTVLNSLKFRDTATGAVKTVTIASGAWVIT